MPSGYPLIDWNSEDRPVPAPNMAGVRTSAGDLECLLVTRDASLIDAVTATALAIGVTVVVAGDRDELRMQWPAANVRLVGTDMASRVTAMGSRDGDTWVVGSADTALLAASAELRAPALALPKASAQLAEVLSQRQDPGPGSTVVALVGGSGGVGTSSVAVAMSVMAARRGKQVTAVELADSGGGLDLLLGLEATPGVRWDGLANATGELGALEEQLVSGDGISVLALGREAESTPTRAGLDAVLRSLGRTQDMIIVDAGDGQRLSWLGDATPVILVAAHVRGVAAARMVAQQQELARAHLLVRSGPGSTLPADAVAEALGLPLLGAIRHDPAVPRLAGAGASITSRPARRFRHDVNRLVDGVLQ